jgi:hypothetical protein
LVATKVDGSDNFGILMTQTKILQTEIQSDGVFVNSAKLGQNVEELLMTKAKFHSH